MQRPRLIRKLGFFVVMSFLVPATPAQELRLQPRPSADAPVNPNTIVVHAGTRLPLQMANAVTARSARPGHPVFFETLAPVVQEGRIVIPAGSFVYGEVVTARRAGRLKGRSEIKVRLDRLVLPNGYSVRFNALPTNVGVGEHTEVQEEGTLRADTARARDFVLVIGMGASGALVGATAGLAASGPDRVGWGAALGAGAGALAAILVRGPELQIPRGATFDVVLDRHIELDASKLNFADAGRPAALPGPPQRKSQPIIPTWPWP